VFPVDESRPVLKSTLKNMNLRDDEPKREKVMHDD
jgi:hypothetical protein